MDKLLKPEQSAAFQVRRSQRVLDRDFATSGPRLVPTASRGWPLPPEGQCEIELGQGRVGYAAKHRAVMDGADFARLGGHVERGLEADPPGLRVDVVAPIEIDQTAVRACSASARTLAPGPGEAPAQDGRRPDRHGHRYVHADLREQKDAADRTA